MIFSYKYPVVKFFGDDPEDTEVTEKAGSIKTINTDQEPYEAVISAEGSQFHIIFGSHQNGSFLCIPGWHTGCELPIWMMYFGIMNPFLGVMNGLDMKMPQR